MGDESVGHHLRTITRAVLGCPGLGWVQDAIEFGDERQLEVESTSEKLPPSSIPPDTLCIHQTLSLEFKFDA